MSDHNDLILFRKLFEAANVLRSKPQEALVPFEQQITTLSCYFHALASRFDDTGGSIRNASISSDNSLSEVAQRAELPHPSLGEASSSTALPTAFVSSIAGDGDTLDQEERFGIEAASLYADDPQSDARVLLHAAQMYFCSYQNRMQPLKLSFDWFSCDQRLLHLNSIWSVYQRRRARHLDLRERLLLVCSCMSLADEFCGYERGNGWDSKQDALALDLVQGRPPSVQKMGKHTKGFFEYLDVSHSEKKFDTALRLGTKLNVLESIGRACGLGAFLPLLLAFDLSKTSRMPYAKFLGFQVCLTTESQSARSIKKLAQTYGSWWECCRWEYTARFGSWTKDSGELSTDTEVVPTGLRPIRVAVSNSIASIAPTSEPAPDQLLNGTAMGDLWDSFATLSNDDIEFFQSMTSESQPMTSDMLIQ